MSKRSRERISGTSSGYRHGSDDDLDVPWFALIHRLPQRGGEKLGNFLKMEEIAILTFSVFAANAYVEHTDAG